MPIQSRAKPGLRRTPRNVYRTSCRRPSIHEAPRDLAAGLFRAFDRTELQTRVPFCLAPRRAGGHEIVDAHVEMGAHFVRHRVFESVPVEHGVCQGTKAIEHVTPRLEWC